jgi:predicted negative regulator of RcsB-dependent stress response
MEPDITESAVFYKLWAWGDKNRKQLLYGLIVLVVVGIVVAFWLAHKNEAQNDANYALSKLVTRVSANTPEPTPDTLLKITSDYPDTDAAQRALLLGAADLFAAGKYDVAEAQFQKFLKDYNSSPFAAQAALGVASCYDAEGKTNDAVSGYDGVINRYSGQNVVPQARLGMARLLEAQGKFKEARSELEELTHSYPGTISSEAVTRLQELDAAHPEMKPAAPLPQAMTPMANPAAPMVTPAAPKATPAPMVIPAAPAHPAPAATNSKTP